MTGAESILSRKIEGQFSPFPVSITPAHMPNIGDVLVVKPFYTVSGKAREAKKTRFIDRAIELGYSPENKNGQPAVIVKL